MTEASAAEALDEAERLLRTSAVGVLSTLSARAEGWPFGSVVPYAVSAGGEPMILIATIAEHTKNIRADPRVSLLVHEPAQGGDIQAKGRLTVMGYARLVAPDDLRAAEARYLARVPDATSYSQTHDFCYYSISLERLRYIGGFGKIFWLDPERISRAPDVLADVRSEVIAHMNADHQEALRACAFHLAGVSSQHVDLVGVDRWGLDAVCRSTGRQLRFDFDEPAGPDSIRRIVIALVTKAKARASASASASAQSHLP